MSPIENMDVQSENRPEASADASPGRFAIWLWRQARRVAVFVIGSTVLLIGVIMIVAPGPATVVIPLGLAILATEFVWARRWLASARRHLESLSRKAAWSRKTDPEDQGK